MSNMLEQAIADAATLREQALKNAEQSVIDRYSKQIKEAVEQMLEADDEESPMKKVDKVINEVEEEINEEQEQTSPNPALNGKEQGTFIEAPPAWDSRYDNVMTRFTALIDNLPTDDHGMVDLDLGDLDMDDEEKAALGSEGSTEAPQESPEMDLGGLGGEEEGGDTSGDEGGLDDLLSTLQEGVEVTSELLEELEIDYDPINDELGHWMTNRSRREQNAEMAKVVYGDEDSEEEESESDEDQEDYTGKINELHETINSITKQKDQMESVLVKLEKHLEESILSNAKLLYQNRTLSDASLNERQKSKIVEAIANAESTKEAKNLFETLRATVGSTPNSKKGPQSLSESVNRKSNLSAMLNPRQNINESKDSSSQDWDKLQRLAGIKKNK